MKSGKLSPAAGINVDKCMCDYSSVEEVLLPVYSNSR